MSYSYRTLFSSVLAIVVIFGFAAEGSSQQAPGTYIKEAANRLADLVNTAAKQGFSVQSNAFSTGGAMIKKDANRWIPIYTVQLTEGRAYVLLAAGDNDAKDLDLDIQDTSGKTLAEDTLTSPTAVVSFTPKVSGRYTVRLRLYDSRDDLPCYCLATVMARD